jgi:hypothetical protein
MWVEDGYLYCKLFRVSVAVRYSARFGCCIKSHCQPSPNKIHVLSGPNKYFVSIFEITHWIFIRWHSNEFQQCVESSRYWSVDWSNFAVLKVEAERLSEGSISTYNPTRTTTWNTNFANKALSKFSVRLWHGRNFITFVDFCVRAVSAVA